MQRLPAHKERDMYRSTITSRLCKGVAHQSLECGPRPRSVYSGISFAGRVRRAPLAVGTQGSYSMRRQLFPSSSVLKDAKRRILLRIKVNRWPARASNDCSAKGMIHGAASLQCRPFRPFLMTACFLKCINQSTRSAPFRIAVHAQASTLFRCNAMVSMKRH